MGVWRVAVRTIPMALVVATAFKSKVLTYFAYFSCFAESRLQKVAPEKDPRLAATGEATPQRQER